MKSRSRCAHGAWHLCNHKRLSATDISAHASMKNVAKCDTWCELQNPVNHRVFERKLRPKPFGRGHVCLGVTHRVAPPTFPLGCLAGSGYWPPVLTERLAKIKAPLDGRKTIGDTTMIFVECLVKWLLLIDPTRCLLMTLRPRPQVRRDYPLSLSISISGGKETYKDSLSNGERTGNSPA